MKSMTISTAAGATCINSSMRLPSSSAICKIDGGDAMALQRARQTLDANLQLIDPVWGGVYQYSDEVDWQSPHFEKLMSFQADDLRLYSEAYERWHDPRYLAAAKSL